MNTRKFIEKIIKPKFLYLMWQDNTEHRNRYLIGTLYEDKFEYSLEENLREAKGNGFTGFPAFDISKQIHLNPLPVFSRRCPPKDRKDYSDFLKSFGLNPEQKEVKEIEDFTLLGYTGGYVPANPFHLINPFVDVDVPFQFIMRIAGAGRNLPKFQIKEGDSLTVEAEPDNESDSKAIRVNFNDERLGYIQKGLTGSFHTWLNNNLKINISVYRINGTSEYPYVYSYVEVSK